MTPGEIYRHRLTNRIIFVLRSESKKDISGTLKIGQLTAGWLKISKNHLDRDWILVSEGGT